MARKSKKKNSPKSKSPKGKSPKGKSPKGKKSEVDADGVTAESSETPEDSSSAEAAEPVAEAPEEEGEQTIGSLVAALADEGEAIDISDLADVVASVGEVANMEERAREAGVELVAALPIDAEDDLSEVEGEASERLMSIVESLLFAATKPLTVARIRKILKEPTARQIKLALKQLIADTVSRGVCVTQVAGGFLLRTHAENARWVQALLQARPVRLSRPQLETLAIISYRQPITKPEVDHVRGVDAGAVIKLLLEKDLIKIVGKKEEPGRPMLYGTTVHFLEFFNLMSLRDLPDLREFRELSDGTKELLANKMGEDEVEALGQEVLDFSDKADEEAAAKAKADAEAAAEAAMEGEAPREDETTLDDESLDEGHQGSATQGDEPPADDGEESAQAEASSGEEE
jgi:segregation and condensation protein B